MNKHRFSLQSHSFKEATKPSDWKHDLDIKPSEKWNLEGLKSVFSKRCASKILGGQWGPILKNSSPSPWKLRKTTSSAIFCTTGAWGFKLYCQQRDHSPAQEIFNPVSVGVDNRPKFQTDINCSDYMLFYLRF